MLATEENRPELSIAEAERDIDLLDRQGFIDQLVNIAELLSANKSSARYAINGEWGVGKTYVLDAFEEKIRPYGQEGSTLSKYLVFHYNCWQYDFYEEPLIAIVAALLDQLDEQVNLISADQKAKVIAVLKAIGISLLDTAYAAIEEKTGFDVRKIVESIKSGDAAATKEIAETHSFDVHFSFKKALKELSKTIAELSREQTVILVVDELDRCLPEYAIKVLERLHHVFSGIANVQIILAIDKQQLENTVTQIYGKSIDMQRYLAKFIDFEIKLSAGKVSNELETVYQEYFDCFTYDISSKDSVQEICTTLLQELDIRTCKAVVEKSFLCHRLLNGQTEKCDAAVLCVEVFLTLLKVYGLNPPVAKRYFKSLKPFTLETSTNDQRHIFSALAVLPRGLAALNEKYKSADYMIFTTGSQTHISFEDLYGLLLGCFRKIIGFEEDIWRSRHYGAMQVGAQHLRYYIQEYWDFLELLS